MYMEVKKKTAVYGATAFILALLISIISYNFGVINQLQPPEQPPPEQPPEQPILQTFSSYNQLVNFLQTSLKTGPQYAYFNSPWRVAWEETLPSDVARFSYVATDVPEYSPTNIQVAGVDEPDIVKTDGEHLCVASNNTLFILKAYPPEEAEVLSKIEFNGTLGELFLNGDKLVIMGSYGSYYQPYRISTLIDDKTILEVYDISNARNPVLKRTFSISGNYFDSRMINDYVYLIATQPAYLLYDTLVLPKIYSENGINEIDASKIYYANISDYSFAFTTVAAINVHDDDQDATHKTYLLGATSNMYVSPNNIYITFWTQGGGTLIFRIRIENETIEGKAKGEVPGSVLNQFSMDEYNGYFRIATTTEAWTSGVSQNNLYVLDLDLDIVGKLENMAPGERIYSVRFMGDRGYVVTFRQVDPFFAIDLQDPQRPKVLGVLKIQGYSSYLHPYDESHIIGIGKDGSNVKISLLDVSNVTDPQEIYNYQVSGRWSDTPVLSDHKALLFDRSKNLLVMPVLASDYSYSYWQGVYVFRITLEEVALKGRITHLDGASGPVYYYPYTAPGYVKRALYIDDALYTVSDKKVMMHEMETLDEINQIELS